MHNETQSITYIGQVNFRHDKRKFGIKQDDRFSHIYSLGKSGTGKSTLLTAMALSDIDNGNGIAVFDPHGDTSKIIYEYANTHTKKEIIYLDPTNPEYTATFNPLENIPEQYRHLATANLIATFKKIWAEYWGPRLEHILRHAILTLMYSENTTLLNIRTLLTNPQYRNTLLESISDSEILSFWEEEYDNYTPSFRNTVIGPILNKVSIFYNSQALKCTFGEPHSDFQVQDIMDNKKIFIANLSKGQCGEEITMLLGSILTTSFMNAAMFRSSIPEQQRVPFFMYLDEAHSLINSSISGILSECRKYKLGLFLTHQFLEQMDADTLSAIFGNVGTLISFRVGTHDAPKLAKEFQPYFDVDDLLNLPRYGFYIKLMIDGVTSKPFSAVSLPVV